MAIDIEAANRACAGRSPQEIVAYAVEQATGTVIVSTNFRPLEAVLLHMCVQVRPDMPVLWVDHGYNTPETYRFAERAIAQLGLRMTIEVPAVTAARWDAVHGGIPGLDDEEALKAFTEVVKLAPFRRGLERLAPEVWLTALRREQTAFRAGLTHFGRESDGVTKVCPVLEWSEAQMTAYLDEHGLPDERTYFDPTKLEGSRECGLHPGLHDPGG